ncbi:unnamed protein product [Paramecium pentaurelia]|uniref:PiggyBac transposable element-derived protein domain-containing protein n=1 Tax=Paramecium pentaurelia TaxID=43138 RepID=A0A8S1TBB8_9CILI|nr:unnamed protein product [Paramecium pentaurelia]
MKQEALSNSVAQISGNSQQTQILDEIEKYNCYWKQEIILSDCEEQFVQIASDDERDCAAMINFGKALNIQQTDITQITEILNYLDTPQLKMTSLQSPQNVLNYFLPSSFVSTLTEMINHYLLMVLQEDLKQQQQQTQQIYHKKKYKEAEIQFYLGLQILFGVYRFPSLDDYWNAESWLKGGVEVTMPIGRFKFVDLHIFSYFDELQRAKLQLEVRKFSKKLKALYNPDQELIIVEQNQKAYKTYYIFDYDSSQIIDLLVVCNNIKNEDRINRVMRMLYKYSNQNHVTYIMFDLSLERIIQLVDQSIYPVIRYQNINHNLIQMLQDGDYELDQLFLIKQGTQVDIFPQRRLISNRHYMTSYEKIKEQLQEHIINLQQFRSNFYQSSQLNNTEGFHQLRVEFEEYFEIMIHNTFLLIQQTSQSQFRHDLAKVLLNEKGQQIERDRNEAKRKLNVTYKENYSNTDHLSFGLQKQYADQFHTPIPQKQEDTFKYCLVCMKFDGLTKPYYRCQLCEKLLNVSKIFLCPFPCFELFHRNPSDFIDCDMKMLEPLGDGIYFKNESTMQLVNNGQEEDASGKKRKYNKPPPRTYWSFNKEIYRQANINDDQNLNDILNTFKKPQAPAPSPSLLQSIVPQEQQQQTLTLGHKKDMKDIDHLLNQEKEQKDKLIKEMQERDKQLQEQYFQQQYEKQLQKEQETKKSKKAQKESEKKKQLEEQLKNVSPLEKFMEQINKRAKVEDIE